MSRRLLEGPAFIINRLLSLNRLGRGTAGFYLLLSWFLLGEGQPLYAHLIWAHTATLWYNGFNDICDYEVDKLAYGKKSARKVLVSGAMSPRELWVWMIGLLACSLALIWHLEAPPEAAVFFGLGLLSSVLYNKKSKYTRKPSVLKGVLLDVLVTGPFVFFYLFCLQIAPESPDIVRAVLCIGLFIVFGLYGNFVFACKDLTTDAVELNSLPLQLGVRSHDGLVRHTRGSRIYSLSLLLVHGGLWGFALWHGHYAALLLFAHVGYITYRIFGRPFSERQYRKIFTIWSNLSNLFIIVLFFSITTTSQMAWACILCAAHILLSVLYGNAPQRESLLMLRFGRKPMTRAQGQVDPPAD